MYRFRFVPLYLLVFLMLVLIFFQSWTFYLGTANVTFERLVGTQPYKEISDISLRRYKKGSISPHLFTIETEDKDAVIHHFMKACNLQKITLKNLPPVVEETDSEMVEVIQQSPYIYLSKSYDLKDPKKGRMCVLFKGRTNLYLFINGNL